MNYNRMTICESQGQFFVYKLKPEHDYAGSVSGGGYRLTSWLVSKIAKPRFIGSYSECMDYIKSNNAEFISEHGIPC